MILATVVAILVVIVVGAWLVLTQPTFSKNVRSTKSVDVDRLQQHVRKFSEEFSPRDYQHVDNLNRCAAYIAQQFSRAGATAVKVQEFTASGRQYSNVRALFGEHKVGTERLIVGAHYDAVENTPGADDNASGVAGLLELATLLGQYPLPGTVELVAYSLEEPPFFATRQMGSAHHAEALAEEETPVSLMISLEMIGYYNDQPGSQDYPMSLLRLFYPGKGNFLAVVGRLDQRQVAKAIKGSMKGTTDLPIYSISAPTMIPGIDFSDHRNYWEYGHAAVMVTDTAFYRNQEYHGRGDTVDRLDYQRMGQAVVAVYEALNRYLLDQQ